MGIAPYLYFGPPMAPHVPEKSGKTVLDIGGGPVSLLLKCPSLRGTVLDPCEYPSWVIERYRTAGIGFVQMKAEDYQMGDTFDEVWIYNCIQHVEDPERIILKARSISRLVRIFEWLYTPITPGHLQSFTEQWLDKALGGTGKIESFQGEAQLYGIAYYGIFKGDRYQA